MKRLIPVILLLFTFCSCEKEQIIEGEGSPSKLETVQYLNDKAWDISTEDPEEAIKLAERALSLASEEFYLQGQKDSHNTLYFIYLNELNDLDKAEYHSKAFNNLTEELKESKDLALLNYKKGYTYYKNEELAKAVPYLFEARDLYLAQGDFEKEAYALYALSKIFEKVDNYQDALQYLNKATFEAVDNSFRWSMYHHQGNLNFRLNNYNEARSDYKKSLEITSKLDQPEKSLKVLDDLALVSLRLEEYDEANQFIIEGISLSKKLNNTFWEAKILSKQAYWYEKQGDFNKSLDSYSQAQKLFYSIEENTLGSQMSLSISRVHLSQNRIKEATNSISFPLLSFDELPPSLQKDIQLHKAKIAEAINDGELKFQSLYEAGQIEIDELKNSQYADVHKAELAYKDKIDARSHEAYIQGIQREIAADERRGKFYLMGFGGFVIICIVLVALYRPYKFFLGSAERVVQLMEDLQMAFKQRLAGQGAIFPVNKPSIKKPEPPDERDIHNLWDKGKKNDEDDGDQPNSGKDN